MQLFYGSASGFSRKARIVALELELPLELQQVNAQADVGTLAELNPLGKIPVLRRADTSIYDSSVICEYLCATFGGDRLLPVAGPDRWQILTWAALGDGINEAGMQVRAEEARDKASAALQWQADKVRRGLDRVEIGARDGSLVGARELDLGQIAVACAIGWLRFRLPHLDTLDSRPRLASWYERLQARSSFQATAPRA